MVEGEKTKESKESAKGAEDTAVKETDKSTESTNSICELKDSPLLTANNELKPYSTDELKDLLGKAKTVELSQQGKSLDTPTDESKKLEASKRAAEKSAKIIDELFPPIEIVNGTKQILPLSAEDEKKLRSIISTSTESDLAALDAAGKKDYASLLKEDPRLSLATREAMAILFAFPSNKRSEENLLALAQIGLDRKNLDIFAETMAEANQATRNQFTDDKLAKAFPSSTSREFTLAKELVQFGKESPFEQIKKSIGVLFDNRDGVKLELGKLRKEDLQLYALGRKLSESKSKIETDLEKMSDADKKLYLFGENIAKGRIATGSNPADETKALERYNNVEALRIYDGLKSDAYWAPNLLPELNALANYPDGKIATALADMRTAGWGAPGVREVAKVIREMPENDLKFYKENPEKREDLEKIIDQLRLKPNDAMALKRYLLFVCEGSMPLAEKAIFRKPVLDAIKDEKALIGSYMSRDMNNVVSIIQNMTDAEINRYRNEPQFRADLRKAVLDGEQYYPSEDSRDSRRTNRLSPGEISIRLLDKIEAGGKPEPDALTKIQLRAFAKNEKDSKDIIRTLQEMLTDETLRARLNSDKVEDRDFAAAFHKAARMAVGNFGTSANLYREIVVPLIKTGVAPIEGLIKSGITVFSVNEKVFEDIAAASPAIREQLASGSNSAKETLAPLGQENMKIAQRVAKEGVYSPVDQVWFGLNKTFSGGPVIMKAIENLNSKPQAVNKFKEEFKLAHPGIDLDAMLKEKLTPVEYARAKFVLSENATEREKYLQSLELVHSAIKGWGSQWTESVFGSATRSQTIGSMDSYTAEVARANRQLTETLADEKVRAAVWKAVENHLTTRSELMMYGGDAAGLGVPIGGAFLLGLAGAEITVPVGVALVLAGTLSRMGVRQGAMNDFYDASTKNVIIDTITSALLSGTAFFGPGQVARVLKFGEVAGSEAGVSAHRVLNAIDSGTNRLLLVEGAGEILVKESQEIIKNTILRAGTTFNEKMIMNAAEKVVSKEGFASLTARQESVNQVFNALKNSLSQSYEANMSAFLRYGKAATADITAGSAAGFGVSVVDDALHLKELGFHNLVAALQAGLFAGSLGTTFRGISQMRVKEVGNEASAINGRKLSENVHEYSPGQNSSAAQNELRMLPDKKALEVVAGKDNTVLRRFEFDTAVSGEGPVRPSRIKVGNGDDAFTLQADPSNSRLWRLERPGQAPVEVQAEITVSPRDGSYTMNYVTDESASWFSRAYADGLPAEKIVRKVSYLPDGRVVYEGPTQNNWFPPEGSVFSKESRLGEYWRTADGKRTWITADSRVYREIFDNVFYANDGVFVEGKEAIKIKEVRAEKLDSDTRWIDENDVKWIDPKTGQFKQGISDSDIPVFSASENGGYYKIHTGEKKFWIVENGKLQKVDYYLASANSFEKSYKALKGVPGHFIKTETMVVRQLGAGEVVTIDTKGGRQVFKEGDYVVLSEEKPRGILKAEYEKLYVDAPSKVLNSDRFTLPPIEGPTSFDSASGIGKAEWVKRVDGKAVDQGLIYWHTKEGLIRVVGKNETKTFSMNAASARGYRFYWADGSAEYVKPEGLRFIKKADENKWIGDDGAVLEEASRTGPIKKNDYDPSIETRKAEPDDLAASMGFGTRGSKVASDANPGATFSTAEGVYKIKDDGQTWFLDKNNVLWSTKSKPSIMDGKVSFADSTSFVSQDGYTYTRNIHGQFWDYGPAGGKWIDSSGQTWIRRPGENTKVWTGEDGSLYREGNWQFAPVSIHDRRRAVQGTAAALGLIGTGSNAANAHELEKYEKTFLALQREGKSADEIFSRMALAIGNEVVSSSKQMLKIAPYLVTGTIAQAQLREMLYQQKQRASSHLRPDEAEMVKANPPKNENNEERTEDTKAPQQSEQLTEAELTKRIESLSKLPRLEGEEKDRTEYVQQSLLDNIKLYHTVDPKKVSGKSEAELRANLDILLKNSTLELARNILIEQKLGVFGPASRDAYNEFLRWSQKDASPALMKQLREWQANVPPNQVRSLIDEASGRSMSPDLYMAKLLSGELKEEGLLNPDLTGISEQALARFEGTFNWLTEANKLVTLNQMQNKELLIQKLIDKSGLPKEWLRKPEEPLPEYLERVEKFVNLSISTKTTIDRLFDLWKRSNPPDFEFSLPPGAAIKLSNSDLIITQENISTAEVQKLLRKGDLKAVDPQIAGDLRWDHPPGSMQRIIDWVADAKLKTDKFEPILEELRKNPDSAILYQDKPTSGMAVKLGADNRFIGLVPPDAKPESKGEIITKDAGVISHNFHVEEIQSGPDKGKFKVSQTVQAFTAPPLAYLDTRALGMEPIGEATTVSEKILSANDRVPVVSGNKIEYFKVSDLGQHKLLQQLNYYGHKTLTGAFDLSILGSVAVTATSVKAIRSMTAAELSLSAKEGALSTTAWTAKDSAKEYAALFARGLAVSTAPINSTGGMGLKYNDMPIGEWINHGRGLFYLSEMSFGLAKGGYAWVAAEKEAARVAAGQLRTAEKLHQNIGHNLPDLMKSLKVLEKVNYGLQAPLAASLTADFYHKLAGPHAEPLAERANSKELDALKDLDQLSKTAVEAGKAKVPSINLAEISTSLNGTQSTASAQAINELAKNFNDVIARSDEKAATALKAELSSVIEKSEQTAKKDPDLLVSSAIALLQLRRKFPERTQESTTLSTEQITRKLRDITLAEPLSARSLLWARELYTEGALKTEQLGALYQDLLNDPNSSESAKLQVLLGFGELGLGSLIQHMREERITDPSRPGVLRMNEQTFFSTLEKLASSEKQPDSVRALASAQIEILKSAQGGRGEKLDQLAKEISAEIKNSGSADGIVPKLIQRLQGKLAEHSSSAGEAQKSDRLAAAQALLLYSAGRNDGRSELAYKAIVSSFDPSNYAISGDVMRTMNTERMKQLDLLDKKSADSLRRQSLDLLTHQSRSRNEVPALDSIDQIKNLFRNADATLKAELKDRLVSFLNIKDPSQYVKSAALRGASIDILADLGAVDAVDKIREHLAAPFSISQNGQVYKFVESDPRVRLSALRALEKFDNSLAPGQIQLKDYLPTLLSRETDQLLAASMELSSDRLGIAKPKLADTLERSIAILSLQVLNERNSATRGWTSDLNLSKKWLESSFDLLSPAGLERAAAENAKGIIVRIVGNTKMIVHEESRYLTDSMNKQFNELVELAGSNDDKANLAKRVLYGLMTRQLSIPGDQENAFSVSGSYPIEIKNMDWAKRAADALAKMADENTSSRDLTSMFLLDALLEVRDPRVSNSVLNGIQAIAKVQADKVKDFVSHRLSEYLDPSLQKTNNPDLEFAKRLLGLADELKIPGIQSKLSQLRLTSPYPELREAAKLLMYKNLDPLQKELKQVQNSTLTLEQRRSAFKESLEKSSDEIRNALRDLAGSGLAGLESDLKKAFDKNDPALKLLLAQHVIKESQTLNNDLGRRALSEASNLASLKENPNASIDENDLVEVVKLRAGELLKVAEQKLFGGSAQLINLNDGVKQSTTKALSLAHQQQQLPLSSNAWLEKNYPALSRKGIQASAELNARGILSRQLESTEKIIAAEERHLHKRMSDQFDALAKHATQEKDNASALKIIYEIASGKTVIPGTVKNPLSVKGSYPLNLAQETDWSQKAADLLVEYAGKTKNEAAKQLLVNAMLETRDPRVAERLFSGLAAIEGPNSTSMQALVSHRLSEYLNIREVHDKTSGKFIAQLMDYAHEQNDPELRKKIEMLKQKSPHPEVKAKAQELALRDLDPIRLDLKQEAAENPDITFLKTKLESTLKAPGDDPSTIKTRAEALRNLEGKQLSEFTDLLARSLECSDARTQFLAARLVFDERSGLAQDHKLVQSAMQKMAALALYLPRTSEDAGNLDQSLALRKRAAETLQMLAERLPLHGVKVTLAGDRDVDLRVVNGKLELVESIAGKTLAKTFTDGKTIRVSEIDGQKVVNRNGVEFVKSKLAGFWTEKNTGLTHTSPSEEFLEDMKLSWMN